MVKKMSHYRCLPALIFLLLSLGLMTCIHQGNKRDQALALIAETVARADAETDSAKAIDQYQKADKNNPLIKVRIMRRQWLIALARFREYQGDKKRPNFSADNLKQNQEYDQLLLALQQSGQSLLKLKLTPAIAWRTHNLLGASYLLQALTLLADDQGIKQSQACLELAINHFKQAITEIDKDPEALEMSNIPRWNLEFISTQKSLVKLNLTRTGGEDKFNLKQNLATMLPESAGYLGGEPPDSRVRK